METIICVDEYNQIVQLFRSSLHAKSTSRLPSTTCLRGRTIFCAASDLQRVGGGSMLRNERVQNIHDQASSLVEVVRARAAHQADQRAYTFLRDGESQEEHLTYGELDELARKIGAALQARGVAGQRVLLVYPSGLELVAAFFGCLYAGAVAIPAFPPPLAKTRLKHKFARLVGIVEDARPPVVLTSSTLVNKLGAAFSEFPALCNLPLLTIDEFAPELAQDWRDPGVDQSSLAFLQYTSGSTGEPKGVMVSHGNLLHNSEGLGRSYGHTDSSVIVSWLPLFHDMGLIGQIVQAAYAGILCVFMSPVHFHQRPVRWLRAISRYRATTSGGPNFAYELCARRVPAEELEGLDLSRWKVAFNGAEPVRAETLERFAEVFRPYGFRREAFVPGYGLAEATLMVSSVSHADSPRLQAVAGAPLRQGQAVPVGEQDSAARTFVSCGAPHFDLEVVLVEPADRKRCAEGGVGEIWVAGPSVAQGYWNRPEQTDETFGARLRDGAGPFLRTGDLGFWSDGELCIAGRSKDLLIIRGQNHYPQDIESTVGESHQALQSAKVAALNVSW